MLLDFLLPFVGICFRYQATREINKTLLTRPPPPPTHPTSLSRPLEFFLFEISVFKILEENKKCYLFTPR